MKVTPAIRVIVATVSQPAAALLQHALSRTDFAVETVSSSAVTGSLTAVRPAAVLLELEDTVAPLNQLRAVDRQVPVMVVLREARAELAFAASKAGADELLTLPAQPEEIVSRVTALAGARAVPPPPSAEDRPGPPVLFGNHPRMAEIRDTIAKVAATSATVLIRGESGVGKDVVSRMIYEQSKRAGKPFVKVNCAAIPDDLLESELFGYEAGAFTGAVRSKPGRFELAHTGTIFLDEIGEMQPALQAKLLHVLQDGAFPRLGAKSDVQVDLRVLCATNKLLEQRVAEGLFREDLFYRINVVTVHIPPLRERKDEIMPLIRHFLDKYAQQYSRAHASFSEEAMAFLLRYSWPGNIRELENLCKRFVIVGGETQIMRELAARHQGPAQPPVASPVVTPAPAPIAAKPEERPATVAPKLLEVGKKAAWQAEKKLILDTLEATRWNRKETARRLQISYRALRNKIEAIDAESSIEQTIAS